MRDAINEKKQTQALILKEQRKLKETAFKENQIEQQRQAKLKAARIMIKQGVDMNRTQKYFMWKFAVFYYLR